MRLTALMIALPIALAGCVGSPSRPLGVDVSAAGIEVSMSNRQTCVGPAPAGGGSWSGTLQGCDSPYPYRVTLDEGGNPIRGTLVEVFGAIGLQLSPIATVEIDGPAGNTWTFTSPPPSQFD
ncbi:hypothetical protein [Jannaschia sp. CCS1]|uniref:hypothetical protein n=1 Tax=Jannaschia sp. (strain CCS1) TaxID=290400 RepID=UPI000053D894|nr:hypothetical protein [Jannaschia sp. CCS1]ABD56299.1 hypothetical protein Jann_3382 [Jannaschia sp. CCS1]